MRLTSCKCEPDRQAVGIDHRMNLSCWSGQRLPHGYLLVRTTTGLPPLKWSSIRYGFEPIEEEEMARKRHTAEEIVAKLRQVDVLMSQGRPVAEAVRSIGVTEVTYYRWRRNTAA